MHLQLVEERTAELAESVGPLSTLLAMARLEDALESLDRVVAEDFEAALGEADGDPAPGEVVIDLREVREVLRRTEPVLERAAVRIEDLAGALDGR